MRCTRVLLLLAVIAAGCGEDAPTVAPACNPLGGGGCIAPWPSSIYMTADATSATGYRVDIPEGALPTNGDGTPIDPRRFNEGDGFSPSGFAFITFEGGVDPSNLVHHSRYDDSVTDASPTVLLDMDTGERVAHFAEVDANAMEFELDEQALYIRPANRLLPGHRYAVAIRKSLTRADGGELAISPAFARLLAGETTGHARLDAIADRFPAIFDALETAGIPRDDLVVAWDFVVASDDWITAPMLSAREAVLAAAGDRAANVTYTVDTDDPEDDDERIMRRVVGRFQAPMILTDKSDFAELAVDASGDVTVTGEVDSRYVAVVPACAAAQRPVPMIIFGHGFFGDIAEAQSDYLRRVADEMCMVVIGTEWFGMARKDIAGAALALNEGSRLIGFGERMIQGITNFMVLVQLARGAFATELLVEGTESLVDPDAIYFYGISQGHVLGTTLMAYDPVLERAALAVGGTNWSLLFERSTNWPNFHLIINGAYTGALNTVIIESLMQLGLDRIENQHIAHRILGDDRLPGTPPKQLLLNMAVGDTQVTNLSSEMQARALGIPVLSPTVKSAWGVPERDGPLPSALAIYDEKPMPMPPDSNARSLADNGTHGTVRLQAAPNRQILEFFTTGQITNHCAGACDCSTGACD